MESVPVSGHIEFKGYVALFGEPDGIGDVIVPGAFARSLRQSTDYPLHWQHRMERQIGSIDHIAEDAHGLFVRGHITDRQAALLIARGEADGLSFGYRARGFRRTETGRELHDINLIEVSVVTHPLHPKARLNAATHATERVGSMSSPKVAGEDRELGQ